MYELIKITEKCYYVSCPSKIGIIKVSENQVCLIDSGNDMNAAKKVLKILDENSWTLTAIYNTHSHADHIGGNHYLQTKTGCKIYAPTVESFFTKAPIFEPSFLYGGYPHKDLRHKFLLAEESYAEVLTENDLPSGVSAISLPGHFFAMVGFAVDDGTVFLADCLSSIETLEKYAIGYIYDVGAYIETLENVKKIQGKIFIPSHASPTSDIAPLADYNINKVYEISDNILALCKEPLIFEVLLQKLFDLYGLRMTHEQYSLVGSTVKSYLSWLKDGGKIEAVIENNMIYWKTV